MGEVAQQGAVLNQEEEVTAVTSFVQIVDPAHEFRNLDRRNVEIDNEALLPTSCKHAVKLHILARVDLLMWHVGRDVDEIPRRGLCDEFQAIAQRRRARPLTT